MLTDAHCHLDDALLPMLLKHNIAAMINCDSLDEWQKWRHLESCSNLTLSLGIHPWTANRRNWEKMKHGFEHVSVIGEIGLDSVWCKTDMQCQRAIFERQLDYAAHHQKPVILHTKGEESQVADMISHYPNRYLVHWYSCLSHIEKYIALDCYFSVGPSFQHDPAVNHVIQSVDVSRLLIESDGLSALRWALKMPLTVSDYHPYLESAFHFVASEKKHSTAALQRIIRQNLFRFLRAPTQ